MEKKILFASGLLATVIIFIATLMQPSTITSAQQTASTVPFTRLVQGDESGVTRRVNYILTSSEELKALWKLIGATSTPPEVDFKSEAVLAVFAGESPRTKVAVTKISDAQDIGKRIVSIVLVKPEGSCLTQERPSSSFEMVAVTASSLPLTHEDIIATTSCTN